MKNTRFLFVAAQAALTLSLTGCAATDQNALNGNEVSILGPAQTFDEGLRGSRPSPRATAIETLVTQSEVVASREPSATSEEDLRRLRGGRERSTTMSNSSTKIGPNRMVKSNSSDTEVVNTVTETVVEMTPVAAGNEDF